MERYIFPNLKEAGVDVVGSLDDDPDGWDKIVDDVRALGPISKLNTLKYDLGIGVGAFIFQERPGKNAKIFRVAKFMIITDERDANGKLLPDAQRHTKVGRFIRSTSIDELPQLWNVFKGDMSLIGPRPLLVQYLPLYSPEQARRLEVRPGITGWAQCHGRNAISWQKKFELDVWYVDHISFASHSYNDKKVLGREDINSATSATMEPFNGYN